VHHAGPFGGASRSLFELIRSFPAGSVRPFILTPRGQFQEILKKEGIDSISCLGVSQFDNTHYSYYRGIRWLVLLRECIYLPPTLWGLLKARCRLGKVDIVHINDLTLVPVIWLASRLFSCPVVVHVRSVQRQMTDVRGKMLSTIYSACASCFIAIDETVSRSLGTWMASVVIHNGLVVSATPRESVDVKDDVFTVGMVGGLARAKGCLEFVEAARICRDRGVKVRFVFVGQRIRRQSLIRDSILRWLGLSQEIERELQLAISSASLQDTVEFWPFTLDLGRVYPRFDALCFPSHFDAPGRPIFEAALYGVPSIAAISQPMPDTIIDSSTGIVIPPQCADRLAEAILSLARDPEKAAAMGAHARELALKNFDINKNALRVLSLYEDLVASR
jgi:glycosyltransferase involved in cell wall biosynthesis